jgi:hypothetical protein
MAQSSSVAEQDADAATAPAVPQMLQDYFNGSGMSLQDYFKFPEMRKIRNPVHEYFRLRESSDDSHWIEEGTLPIEEGEDGWVLLGAEHQELARIAVAKGGNRHYYAIAWDGSYIGPILRTTSTVAGAGWYVVKGTASITGAVVGGVVSTVLRSSPGVPPADAPLEERFVEESVEIDGDTWFFRIWLPPDLEQVRKDQGSLPAFLLLHGFKECGWDNWWQTNAGLSLHLQNQKWAWWFPGIVVIPQLPRRPWDEKWWQHWRSPQMQNLAMACLEKAVAKYRADRKRLASLLAPRVLGILQRRSLVFSQPLVAHVAQWNHMIGRTGNGVPLPKATGS